MGRLILYYWGIIVQEHTNESYQQSKISEYELLTKYNPKYINSKIKTAQSHIDEMYHLSTSITTCDDIMGVISVSYPVDKLVIWISETKNNLKRFKDDSAIRLYLLKQVLNTYTKEEQQKWLDTCNRMDVSRRMSSLNVCR